MRRASLTVAIKSQGIRGVWIWTGKWQHQDGGCRTQSQYHHGPNQTTWGKRQPSLFIIFLIIIFFFSFTCRGVSENDQHIYSFCFKSNQLYNQYLNDCVNDADLAENLTSTFQTWYFFKLSCSLGWCSCQGPVVSRGRTPANDNTVTDWSLRTKELLEEGQFSEISHRAVIIWCMAPPQALNGSLSAHRSSVPALLSSHFPHTPLTFPWL